MAHFLSCARRARGRDIACERQKRWPHVASCSLRSVTTMSRIGSASPATGAPDPDCLKQPPRSGPAIADARESDRTAQSRIGDHYRKSRCPAPDGAQLPSARWQNRRLRLKRLFASRRALFQVRIRYQLHACRTIPAHCKTTRRNSACPLSIELPKNPRSRRSKTTRRSGPPPASGGQRVFGGQVIGRGSWWLRAELSTWQPPSLRAAYFLLGGDPSPIVTDVDRIRTAGACDPPRGRDPAQPGDLFSMAVSFRVEEQAATHQAKCPTFPRPDQLPMKMRARGPKIRPEAPESVRRFCERERRSSRAAGDVWNATPARKPRMRPSISGLNMRRRCPIIPPSRNACAYASDMCPFWTQRFRPMA